MVSFETGLGLVVNIYCKLLQHLTKRKKREIQLVDQERKENGIIKCSTNAIDGRKNRGRQI